MALARAIKSFQQVKISTCTLAYALVKCLRTFQDLAPKPLLFFLSCRCETSQVAPPHKELVPQFLGREFSFPDPTAYGFSCAVTFPCRFANRNQIVHLAPGHNR